MYFFVFLYFFIAAASFGNTTIINGTAVTLSGKVYTYQDVQFWALAEGFLLGKCHSTNTDKNQMLRFIEYQLLLREMKVLNYVAIEAKKMDKSSLEKSSHYASCLLLVKQLGRSEKEFITLIQDVSVTNNFFENKLKTMSISPTDSEIELYYKSNPAQFAHRPLPEVKDQISAIVREASQQNRYKEWLDSLKLKYRVEQYFN